MDRKYRVPWRGMEVHIIDGSTCHIIGDVKWVKILLIILKMVANGFIGRTPGLQIVAK